MGKKLKTDVPMEYNRQEDMDEKAYKSAMLKICNSIVGLCLGIIVSIIFMVFIYNANYIQSLWLWIQIAYIVIPLIVLLIEIWSYISIIMGLGCLVKAVNKNDIMAIKMLRISSIIFGAAPIVITPFILWFGWKLGIQIGSAIMIFPIIVSIVFRFIGVVKLRKSETFPGKAGANTIFTATTIFVCGPIILALLRMIISLIDPTLNELLSLIIPGLVGFVFLFALAATYSGWKKMEKMEDTESKTVPIIVTTLLVVIILIEVLNDFV